MVDRFTNNPPCMEQPTWSAKRFVGVMAAVSTLDVTAAAGGIELVRAISMARSPAWSDCTHTSPTQHSPAQDP